MQQRWKRWILWLLIWIFIVVFGYQSSKQWLTSMTDGNDTILKDTLSSDSSLTIDWLSSTTSSWSVEFVRSWWSTTETLRGQIIEWLTNQWFTWRSTHPYSWYVTNGLMSYQWSWIVLWQDNTNLDVLDEWIEDTLTVLNKEWVFENRLWIEPSLRTTRENILLFKNQNDLEELWYEVISTRRRISTDTEYRRKNIAQSFALIGHVRVIPPSGDLRFMAAAQYDGITRENYEYGYVVVGNQEKIDYAWWICGASSAIYQWIVSNWSLQTPRVRNHTRWYWYLYNAYIDGKLVTTPWIDSAVFDGSLDLELVNTASHPIILVMNYDGTLWWVEEVFTIGRVEDKQDVKFVSSYPITYTWPSWIWTWTTTTEGGCYTRMIGDEEVKRCYRKVSD